MSLVDVMFSVAVMSSCDCEVAGASRSLSMLSYMWECPWQMLSQMCIE